MDQLFLSRNLDPSLFEPMHNIAPPTHYQQHPRNLVIGHSQYRRRPSAADPGQIHGSSHGQVPSRHTVAAANSSVAPTAGGPTAIPYPTHQLDSTFSGSTSSASAAANFNKFPSAVRRSRQQQRFAFVNNMGTNDDDIAAQMAAARDFQPVFLGPLVGAKTGSEAIAEEYAKADATYVQKTLALPQTYSHYRPIQGDGNCGWRAIAFGYLESLLQYGDKARIEAEFARITELNNFIETAGGFSRHIFEDMADETRELLREISNKIDQPAEAIKKVEDAFNDPTISNQIIYHLRLLASSYMKANEAEYANFISDGSGVADYCGNVIELPGVEIEHVGINLLVNILLKPAGIVLEIAYLDRSEGNEVNTYQFTGGEDTNQDGPVIYLLYRPTHYDILYARVPPPPPPPIMPVNIAVNNVMFDTPYGTLASRTSQAHRDFSGLSASQFEILAQIPGFSNVGPGFAPTNDSPYGDPASQWASPYEDTTSGLPQISGPSWHQAPAPAPAPVLVQPAAVPVAPYYQPAAPQYNRPPVQSPQVRFNNHCFELPVYTDPENWLEEVSTCQSSPFRNSPLNVAHFSNAHFQPIEYKAESFGQRAGSHSKDAAGPSRGSARVSGRKSST